MNQHIENSINDINNIKKEIKATTNDTEIANSKITGESENPSPKNTINPVGSVLFNQITEGTIQILQSPEIENSLTTMGEHMNMDEESIAALINIVAICMNNSAYQAILFYDDLLKEELTKQMDNVGHHINLGKADMEAFKSVLQIHQKQINEVRTILKLDTIKKENDISQNTK